jgi:hypothetical protein
MSREVQPLRGISALAGRAFTMRIHGTNAPAVSAPQNGARRSAGGTFSVADSEARAAPGQTAALRAVGGIEALLALQGLEDPAERRRRAVKHGRKALDALDDLKLALLAGNLDQSALLRLRAVAGDLKVASGDSALDGVLAEIDLRVEVELAKAGIR